MPTDAEWVTSLEKDGIRWRRSGAEKSITTAFSLSFAGEHIIIRFGQASETEEPQSLGVALRPKESRHLISVLVGITPETDTFYERLAANARGYMQEAEIKRLTTERDAARADAQRLREALATFIDVAMPPEEEAKHGDGLGLYTATLGMVRRARTALAASPEAEQGWRPIETAPRDGTEIIGLYSNGEEASIRWAESRKCMLAGIGGGNGYFEPGWEDVENGLIADEPERWRSVDPEHGGRADGR